jgi:hypothetical protein
MTIIVNADIDLLKIARDTGLRQQLTGMNANDARELLRAFVAAIPGATKRIEGDPADAAVIVATLEAAGVEFQHFMGGVAGTKGIHNTAGSQSVEKIVEGVRALLAAALAAPEALKETP